MEGFGAPPLCHIPDSFSSASPVQIITVLSTWDQQSGCSDSGLGVILCSAQALHRIVLIRVIMCVFVQCHKQPVYFVVSSGTGGTVSDTFPLCFRLYHQWTAQWSNPLRVTCSHSQQEVGSLSALHSIEGEGLWEGCKYCSLSVIILSEAAVFTWVELFWYLANEISLRL